MHRSDTKKLETRFSLIGVQSISILKEAVCNTFIKHIQENFMLHYNNVEIPVLQRITRTKNMILLQHIVW